MLHTPQQSLRYTKIKPSRELEPFIHFYWELKGNQAGPQWERVFADGCTGVFVNLGETCLTDNGSVSLESGKTYVVGAMQSFKDSFIDCDTHLLGVCLKPAAFANFYTYAPQSVLTNATHEFERSHSFNPGSAVGEPFRYLDHFFCDRIKSKSNPLQAVINDMNASNGQACIRQLAKRNFTTLRQLERKFKKYVGLSPKEYLNIVRFQRALRAIRYSYRKRNLLDIAFECGYYDQAHFSKEVKRMTGLSPSQLKNVVFLQSTGDFLY